MHPHTIGITIIGLVWSYLLYHGWQRICIAHEVVQHTAYIRNSHVYYTSLQVSLLQMIDLQDNHVNLILSSCHYSVEIRCSECRIYNVPPADLRLQSGIRHTQ